MIEAGSDNTLHEKVTMQRSENKTTATTGEKRAPITDAASRYAALRSHAIRLEEAIDPNAERVDKIGKMDVIFGRGKGLQKHPGNKRMRSIIDRYKVEYHASNRSEKKDMVVKVYNEIVEGGIRFLKKLDDENAWILVDEPVAMEKVSHTLRCRKLLKGTLKERDQSSTEEKSLPSGQPSSITASSINKQTMHPHTGQPQSLKMNRAGMMSSIQGNNPYLQSLYGNLAGAPSASSLGAMGTLGTIGTGASLADLPAGSFSSGIGAYGVAGNRPMIALTDMEYFDILRRRQQQSLMLPAAHASQEAAMMQSARLQLAANNRVGNLAADGYPREFSREDGGGQGAPNDFGGNFGTN